MKKVFITYGDENFIKSRDRLKAEAVATGEFDNVIAYGVSDLSEELKASAVFKMPKGGLWSWKPDVVHTALQRLDDGDFLMYLDAGSSVVPGSEWSRYWAKLQCHEMIAQRIYGITKNWTRKSLMDFFPDAGQRWRNDYQYSAMIVMLKVSPFTRLLVEKWWNTMIYHPELIEDVPPEAIKFESPRFHQNRYDQAVYSALIHEALNNKENKNRIYTQWEHVEDRDPFRSQVVFATRIGDKRIYRSVDSLSPVKRVVRDFALIPMLSFYRILAIR